MSVADTVRKKRKITPTTRTAAMINVICTSLTEARIDWLRSKVMSSEIEGGSCARSAGNSALIESTTAIVLAPG